MKIYAMVNFNLKDLLDVVLRDMRVELAEKGKKLFYYSYLKTVRLKIGVDGNVSANNLYNLRSAVSVSERS